MLNKIDHETDGSLKGKKHLVRRELLNMIVLCATYMRVKKALQTCFKR